MVGCAALQPLVVTRKPPTSLVAIGDSRTMPAVSCQPPRFMPSTMVFTQKITTAMPITMNTSPKTPTTPPDSCPGRAEHSRRVTRRSRGAEPAGGAGRLELVSASDRLRPYPEHLVAVLAAGQRERDVLLGEMLDVEHMGEEQDLPQRLAVGAEAWRAL